MTIIRSMVAHNRLWALAFRLYTLPTEPSWAYTTHSYSARRVVLDAHDCCRSTCRGWRHHVCPQHQFRLGGFDGTYPLFHNTGVTWALTFKCWFLMVVVKLCVSLPHVPLQPHDFVVCWPPNPSQLQWHLPLMIYSGMIVSRKWKVLLHHRHVKMAAWPVLLQNFLQLY